jgi:steroid delta-isomerase-like uncharacterized protein
MTRNELHEVYQNHLAAEQRRDAEAAAATYVEHGYYRVVPLGFDFNGRAAVAAQYATVYAAFPDFRFDIEGEIVESPQLFHWGTMRATATGEFFGLPPSGRSVALPFSARFEFGDGAMLGETVWYDLATLCDQVGAPIAHVRDVASQMAAQLRQAGA